MTDSSRVSAMAFGRPTIIQKTCDVPLPAMVDDRYLGAQTYGSQPPDISSSLGFFVWSCRLLDLLADAVDLLYSRNETSRILPKADVITQTMDLNRRLDDFYNSLPAYLLISSPMSQLETTENSVKLQREVLYCR